MALSAKLLARMQRKLGISDDQSVFTDDELNDLYDEANQNFYLAIVYGIDEILIDAAKLNNFSAGQTKENKSEVFDHLNTVRANALENSQRTNQVLIVGIRPVPPRKIAKPITSGTTHQVINPVTGLVREGSGDNSEFGIALGPDGDQ